MIEHKNQRLQELIARLKKQSLEHNVGVWKRIALELERPTRQHRAVNLSRISAYCTDNDVVVVPGKLLSGGSLDKKVTIIAYNYSQSAAEKIKKTATIMTLDEAMKKYPKGNTLKIIG